MAKDKLIKFVVVTPERQVLEETAEAIVIPAHDGALGIWRDRAPLMCELGVGQMRYRTGGTGRRVFIDGGFAQVLDNDVTVLTGNAAPADEITDEMIREAERAAAELPKRTFETVEAHRRARRRIAVLRALKGAR